MKEVKKDYNYYLKKKKILYYLCKFKDNKKALNAGPDLNKDKSNLFNPWNKKLKKNLINKIIKKIIKKFNIILFKINIIKFQNIFFNF